MKVSIDCARSAAITYACFAFAAGLLLLISAIEQLPVGWRKVVSALAITVFVPLPPVVAFRYSERVSKTNGAKQVVAWGVMLSCLLPVAMLVLIAMSSEPLAMLAMFYVPPLQLILLAAALLVAWRIDRA